MTKPVTTQSVVLPAPIAGINKKDALANLQPQFAVWIEGFSSGAGYLKVREGFVIHSYYNSGDASDSNCLGAGAFRDSYNGDTLFAIMYYDVGNDARIVNMTSTSPSSVYTGGSDTPDAYIFLNFNGCLFVIAQDPVASTCHFKYDGSSWSDLSFTYSGAGIYGYNGLYYYKGRPYLYTNTGNSFDYYYGTVGAVAGATTLESLDQFFDESKGLSYITSATISDVISSQEFICYGGSYGEILIYSGDYPLASNWEIAGKFKTAPPIGRTPIVKVNGDSFVITENGIVSIRALFQYGDQAATSDFSLSAQINPYIISLVKALRVNSNAFNAQYQWASGVYWPDTNSIIFNIWGALDKNGTWKGGTSGIPDYSTIIQYDLSNQSWTINFINAALTQLMVANGKLYAGAYNVNGASPGNVIMVELFKASTYKDEVLTNLGTYQGIPFDLISAPMLIGGQQSVKRVVAFEPILNTDSYGASASAYYMKAITDFGRSTSEASYMPVLADGYTRAYFSVGNEGTFFQYELAGTTNKDETIGLELYSTNVYYEQGGNR